MEDWAFVLAGITIGAAVIGAICLLVGKLKMKIGTFRPQVMVVLLALCTIAVLALNLKGMENIGTLAVGGLIALATRIIEKDGGKSSK